MKMFSALCEEILNEYTTITNIKRTSNKLLDTTSVTIKPNTDLDNLYDELPIDVSQEAWDKMLKIAKPGVQFLFVDSVIYDEDKNAEETFNKLKQKIQSFKQDNWKMIQEPKSVKKFDDHIHVNTDALKWVFYKK